MILAFTNPILRLLLSPWCLPAFLQPSLTTESLHPSALVHDKS